MTTLSEDALALCHQIEKCGASPELTQASIMAAALFERLKYPTGTLRVAVRNAEEEDTARAACARCDGPGNALTLANQACLPINGKVQCIDWCIHQIVAALTAGGIETVASCCGHGTQRGRIDLKDGRVLWIETPAKPHQEKE